MMNCGEVPLSELLDLIAARTPTPGGGAVAAMTVAMAASLASLVVNYSSKRDDSTPEAEFLDRCRSELEQMRARALTLAEEDAAAYRRLSELQKLNEDDPARRAGWRHAVEAAIDAPRCVLDLSMKVLIMCGDLVSRSNRRLRSDLAIAAVLAEAAASSAGWNVRINLPLLSRESDRERVERETAEALSRAGTIRSHVEDACR